MKTIAAVVLALLSGSVMADWELIGNTNGNTTKINKSSIRKQGNVVRIWTMQDYADPLPMGNGRIANSSKILIENNCKEESYRYVSGIFYGEHNGSGMVVLSDDKPDPFLAITPGTINETLWNAACKNKRT